MNSVSGTDAGFGRRARHSDMSRRVTSLHWGVSGHALTESDCVLTTYVPRRCQLIALSGKSSCNQLPSWRDKSRET